ncbi:MAG: NPCBM/NEW2 domain-containing protein, partial [Planctomycetota bacterium]|nr:NPCBM/NEW2 domain-containing protein [Planctomycetota bacterium]
NGNGSDWADWVQPKLTGPAGTKKLIELEWTKAYAQWGKVYVGKNANGEPLKVQGKIIQDAIGTHASSVISYDLPPGYERFEALVTNEDGHAGQIQFMVFTEEPDLEELKNTEIPKGSKPIDPLAAFCLVLMNTNEFVYMN